MTAVPTFPTGHEPSADEFSFITDVRKYRIADQAVNNTTTLVNDDTLFFTPAVNTVWAIDEVIFYSAGTIGDLKIAFTWPAGASFPWGYQGVDASLAASSIAFPSTVASGTSFAAGGNNAGNVLIARVVGLLTMSSTPGTFQFQFSQNANDAGTNTTVRVGSWMHAVRFA